MQLGADIDGEAANDRFGFSVSLSADGSRVAIGATSSNLAAGRLRVYEYVTSGTTSEWTQLGSDIDGEAANDLSGSSVSLSADGARVAIAARSNDGAGVDAGHVRVYEYTTTGTTSEWTQLGSDIDGEAASDFSGWSVSLSADGARVAIGARLNDGTGLDAGHVRVYEYITTGAISEWTQLGSDIDGEAANDELGYSVSLSADGARVAIGAPQNDGNGLAAGHVRVYEYTTTGTTSEWTQLGSDIDGEAIGDRSGQSVSLSADGARVAIGAPLNAGTNPSAGHVRVYEYTTTGTTSEWTQLGPDIDGEAFNDRSGYSVSLSADGTRVAIGADRNSDTATFAGHVRMYELLPPPPPPWVQVGSDIDGEAAGDASGWSTSLSADGARVAIGAIQNDGTGLEAGHVRVYEYTTTGTTSEWTQLGSDIDGETANDFSGRSVSLSADGARVAIGADGNDGTGLNVVGHVRVYEYTTTGTTSEWTQLGSDIDGEAANDLSGQSVSLSADGARVAIGARLNDGTGIGAGHVRVYEYTATGTTSEWTQLGSDIDGEAAGDESGISVSLSADGARVAIGAPLNDGTASAAGHVRVYEYTTTGTTSEWTQLASDIDGEAASDESGFSVSLSSDGTRVAIGARLNDGTGLDAGHVRVYEYTTTGTTSEWTQLGSDIGGEDFNDLSGYSVSLSADGARVAIGARINDGTDLAAGHVRVYEYSTTGTTSEWTQLRSDIDGEAAVDQSGFSVSLSADGARVAIGAPGNDGTGFGAGHVRVYELL